MGAKASTANVDEASGRQRTFSTSSGSEDGGGGAGLLRSLPARARSIAAPASDDSNQEDGHTVYSPHSLSSHIYSLNGLKCPVCSKWVLPEDIECHLVMCLTKPRLVYNEDVLSEDKGECVICLEELSQGDTIARLPCLCVYHKACIDRWFDVNRSCPEHPGY